MADSVATPDILASRLENVFVYNVGDPKVIGECRTLSDDEHALVYCTICNLLNVRNGHMMILTSRDHAATQAAMLFDRELRAKVEFVDDLNPVVTLDEGWVDRTRQVIQAHAEVRTMFVITHTSQANALAESYGSVRAKTRPFAGWLFSRGAKGHMTRIPIECRRG